MFRCSADQLLGLKDRNDTQRQIVSVKDGDGGDAGHAAMCRSCPYRKKVQAMEKVLGK